MYLFDSVVRRQKADEHRDGQRNRAVAQGDDGLDHVVVLTARPSTRPSLSHQIPLSWAWNFEDLAWHQAWSGLTRQKTTVFVLKRDISKNFHAQYTLFLLMSFSCHNTIQKE